MKRFFCCGSLNVDITFQVGRMPEEHEKLRCAESRVTFGGSAANTAHWLARLGAETHMLGCVGEDAFGAGCIDALARAGVGVSLIQQATGPATGMAAIFANPASKRMVTSGGANACFDAGRLPDDLFGPEDHLHVATAMPELALALMRRAKAAGATLSCDLNGAPDGEMIPLVDWCFVNRTDLSRCFGCVEPLVAWGRLEANLDLVVTQGSLGATAVSAGRAYFVPARAVRVVDRTGGGDAFDAGYLYALSQGLDIESCLRFGLLMAARVIQEEGSRPEVADLAAVLEKAKGR